MASLRAKSDLTESDFARFLVVSSYFLIGEPAAHFAGKCSGSDDFGSYPSEIMNVIDSFKLERDAGKLERDAGGKPVPIFPHPAPDHDDFGWIRSEIMNVIGSFKSARDAGGKPVPTFPHPA